ncbi:hypothetical protein ABTX35_37025, partial [Streptomyces sp. NPDC096080]
THRTAQRALDDLLVQVAAQQERAEAAAAALHTLRAETDRLTRWHQLPEDAPTAGGDGTPTRGGLPEPTVTDPAPLPKLPTPASRALETIPEESEEPAEKAASEASEDSLFKDPPAAPPRYTLVTDLADSAPALKTPEGATHRLRDVPADNSFYRALQETLPAARHRADGTALDATALRGTFADTVAALPLDSPLLDRFAPDDADTFTSAELASAALDLGTGTPQRREFDSLGVIPHSAGDRPTPDRRYRPLTPAQRRGLAAAQLRRDAGAANGTGWNHGTADLLPALAAARFGVGVRVVTEDGTHQDFSPDPDNPLPDDAERVVLYLADGHFQALGTDAVAEGPPPAPKPEPPVDESLLTAHATRPWTWEGLDDATYGDQPKFDAATDPRTLTDPDGYLYDLRDDLHGEGNQFYSAIADALGVDRQDPTAYAALVDDLADILDTAELPAGARLDPRARFTEEDLYDAGFRRPLPPPLRREFERDGGRLPDPLPELPAHVREGLIRAHLRAARRWNRATALLAAAMVADGRDLHVTLVHENGTIDTFGTVSEDGSNAIVLYERGGDFLAAVPRGSGNPRGPWTFRTTRPTPPSTPPPPVPLPLPAGVDPAGPPGGKGAPKPPPTGEGTGSPLNSLLPEAAPRPPGTREEPSEGRTSLRDALERLDTLRSAVPELAEGPLDLDALARHVLLLPPDTVVTETHRRALIDTARAPQTAAVPSLAVLAGHVLERRGLTAVRDSGLDVDVFAARVLHLPAPDPARRPDLMRLVERAANAGVALDQSVRLGAFHLATRGSLAPDRVIRRTDGSLVGRDLDNRVEPLDVSPSVVTLVGVDADGSPTFDTTDTAPWHRPDGSGPWVVRMTGAVGRGVLSGRIPVEDVAHLLDIDSTRPADRDIVLLLPTTDPDARPPAVERLLDAVSRHTGAVVHTAYGRADFHAGPDGRATIALGRDGDDRRRTVGAFLTAGRAPVKRTRPTGDVDLPRPLAGAKRRALPTRETT